MAVVYLVTSGSYSDYGIRAAFSTKEKAERYLAEMAKSGGASDAGIEEWMLDEADAEVSVERHVCQLNTASGAVEREWCYREISNPNQECRVNVGVRIIHVVSLISAEHARKVAVEARQRHLREEASK